MEPREATDADAPANALLTEDPVLDAVPLDHDPVLTALDAARGSYRQARLAWARREAELEQARRRLSAEVEQLRTHVAHEKRRAERQKHHARHLAEGLKSIHRALFDGNVFSLILRSCLTITNATRGLYVTLRSADEFRIRAAVDFDGYPHAAPSEFLRAVCHKVVADNESFAANDPDELDALPVSPGPGERFHNLLVAPAVLLGGLNGVVVLADKLDGDFDRDDIETVLSVGDQAAVAVANRRLQANLHGAYLSVVGVLADAVEAKDPYTHGHCEMVARYARLTAQRLGLSDLDRGITCYGGLLHDVGKIGISDGVLNKPGKLLPEEWELMRSHVRIGKDLLSNVPVLQQVADVVLLHHEAYDGSGYPQGLKGDAIPLTARIVCVVDAYCAMISKRSYKESSSDEQARAELRRCRGTQFDPAVVDAFLQVLDNPHEADDEPAACGLPPGLNPQEDFQFVFDALRCRAANEDSGHRVGVGKA